MADGSRIPERLFHRFGPRFTLVMILVTRGFCLVGGALTIYYVNLTTHALARQGDLQLRFGVAGALLILFAVFATVILSEWETRDVRRALRTIARREPLSVRLAERAGRQAVLYPGRHILHEALLDPWLTAVPLCAFVWWTAEDASKWNVVSQTMIAAFLGISTVLLATYFTCERWMAPVIRHLQDHGVTIQFDALPPGRIAWRMTICFGITIAVTALMIGGLAYQRTQEIIQIPDAEAQTELVRSLTEHTLLISLVAIAVGLLLSRLLASSVAARAGKLVQAMKRVEAGSFAERLRPVSNDEVDTLARQFNAMVQQLDQNDQTIRELNIGLEHKVRLRTRQLSKSKRSLQRSLRKLREYDQLKTDFFSNISHELRTPLTMILSPVDRIIESHGAEVPQRVTALMDVVRINANRLLELINQLLEFSKLEAGRARLAPSAVDLNLLARDLVTAAEPLAEQRKIELRTRLDTRVPPISADAEKIETVIRNLLSNALKFTPEGGLIEVDSQWHEDHVELGVRDTGIGIAPQDYHRVFERFVQIDGSASRKYSGTGLGLALVKELVELHGGAIHLDSRPNAGSRFWFTLPLTTPVESSPQNVAPPPQPGAPRTSKSHRFAELATVAAAVPAATAATVPADAPRVLIADDTPEMRSLIAEVLSDHYRVSTACDGEEAWQSALDDPPDLIISDVMMPRVDGYEFCRRVKQHAALTSVPFVMLTAKAELTMKIEGLNCGADEYLVKPFSPEELRARVRSLLRLRKLLGELEVKNRELSETLEQLRRTQTQLIQSEKMSSLGQLVAGIAHEINNAINAVYNGIQPLHLRTKKLEGLVAKALAAPPAALPEARDEIDTAFRKITGLADVIEHGAARTAKIVRDLKTFSHPGSEAAERFDLNGSLEMCLNLLSSQLRDRIDVHRDFGEVGQVYGPSGQLNQVFMNILSNAQQAIAGRGEITLVTRRSNGSVSVAVRDSGCGMTAETQGRIFDPFFTTKAPGVGTGLGLSLSYGIISRLGGTISCHSEVGRGTEFVVSFPADCSATPERADPESGTVAESRLVPMETAT